MQPNAAHRLAQSALETWTHVSARVADGEPADAVLQGWWRDHRHYGSRDRRFMAEAIFSAFRWKGWLTSLLDQPAALLGLAYLLDATEAHPVAGVLLKEAGYASDFSPAGGQGVADKARWVQQALRLPDLPALTQLVPAWVPAALPADRLADFISAIQQRPPLWLRTRKGGAAQVLRWLGEQGYTARAHTALPEAVMLDKMPPTEVMTRLEQMGCTAHDVISQCVGCLCDPKPGQSWWDMCAGAGGKTLHLADLMEGRGHILATDIRESALKELDRRARAMRVPGLHLRLLRPDATPPGAPFDGILVDAPCSGLGTWGRNPDARWRTSLENVQRSAATQLTLLNRAFTYLKPGGRLIYATCSVTNLEGPDVIHAFMRANPSAQPVSVHVPLGICPVNGFTTIWPHEGPGTGMFVAEIINT